jgi:hypothetical protein
MRGLQDGVGQAALPKRCCGLCKSFCGCMQGLSSLHAGCMQLGQGQSFCRE